MFSFNAQDVVSSLRKAKNINAAIKNFLKREIRPGVEGERFVKDLRDRLLASDPARAVTFVEPKLDKYAAHLLGIGRYAFSDIVVPFSEEIVENFADKFNATFERRDGEVVVTDRDTFQSIINETFKRAEAHLTKAGAEPSPYMKSLMLVGIFEEDVLKVVRTIA